MGCNGNLEKPISSTLSKVADSTELNSSEEGDDLMMKIAKKELKIPMDSSTANKCFDYMKTNYSLMLKIINDPISSNEKVAQVAMANYLICVNGIELLEKSEKTLSLKMKNEIEAFKKDLERVNSKMQSLYQNIEN
jgi:hypothetical protein